MASPLQMTEMYDNALLGILQHVGNIQDFLRVYFGFLYRKTDFYRLLSGPDDKMGFQPGVAEKMVLKTFKLFEKVAEQDRERAQIELQRRNEIKRLPPAVQEVVVTAEKMEEDSVEAVQVESSLPDAGDTTAAASKATAEGQCAGAQGAGAQGAGAQGAGAQGAGAQGAGAQGAGAQGAGAGGPVAQRDQVAGAGTPSAETQDQFQSNADSYNGAVRENYSWSQDYTDVEVRVLVPETVVKGRQVSVRLQTGSIRVSMRDGAEEKTLMEGELSHKINTEDSLWSLEPGKCVVLSLNKTSEVWWNAVLKGEKEIDINQINRERSMGTVDEEEHAVLDRLTFDYHQKLQGKPQSHEMKVHEMLKKGWDAEGSPFKGQSFDPTIFDVPPSAVQF
ncbi:nudC domain-containing protein 3 [Cololabis saira]|uniref:nudC domain-containing protein 3 n=1 Tax=Cololabis saira TaxID=129043 RepID=UPI002AD51EE6|nr:nudC domain-containing protein 3 [Cololabis saira]